MKLSRVAPAVMILVCSSPTLAQNSPSGDPRFEILGAYSFNTDFVRDQPLLIVAVADQKVSPFFSNGSGPFGFEASVKRYVRGSFGIKAVLSTYFDPGFQGNALYCGPTVCALGVNAKASPRTLYAMVGPEWKFRRSGRWSPFVAVQGGVAYVRTTFEMSGSNLQYANVRFDNVQSANGSQVQGLIVFNGAGIPQNGNVKYTDSQGDAGLALSPGAGFDTRLSRRMSLRFSLNYDPTFRVRPVVTNPTLQRIPSERSRQDHIALSLGLVWGVH